MARMLRLAALAVLATLVFASFADAQSEFAFAFCCAGARAWWRGGECADARAACCPSIERPKRARGCFSPPLSARTHSPPQNKTKNTTQHNHNTPRRRDQVQQEVRHPRLHQVHADGGQQEEQERRVHHVRQGLRAEQRRLQ